MSAQARILVVDDTPANIKLLGDLLAAKGYAVSTATNGEEGLAKIAADKPDLVLVDVMMPGSPPRSIRTRSASRASRRAPTIFFPSR